MADIDGIANAVARILPNIGRFGSGARGPHGMIEGLGGHHRAFDAIAVERFADTVNRCCLSLGPEILGGDDVGIVRGPVADSDFGVAPDHLFETYLWPGGRMEQRLSLIGSGPLRAGD